MQKKITLFVALLLLLLLPAQMVGASNNAIVIPIIKITDVVEDDTVTIKAYNFPKNDDFTVTMGAYGTLGIGGIVVASQNSSTGSFNATYTIPTSLKGSTRIAIRLESSTSYYYSYNWFWNNSTSGTSGGSGTTWGYPPKGANTIPNTEITNVTPEVDVTVKGTNFTTTDTYNVYIGKFGTKGVGGVKVATQDTDANGKFTETFAIPNSLKTEGKLAIRFVSPATGYYAYDWFTNTGVATPGSGAGSPPAGANTIPTFSITAVVEDNTVTIKGTNFTTNDTYKVYMGLFGTKGVGGIEVDTQNTDNTGKFSATYSIPNSLKSESKIAIRLQSSNTNYYSYNWFYNSDYP